MHLNMAHMYNWLFTMFREYRGGGGMVKIAITYKTTNIGSHQNIGDYFNYWTNHYLVIVIN